VRRTVWLGSSRDSLVRLAVGLVAAPHHMLLVAMTLFAVLLGIRYWL